MTSRRGHTGRRYPRSARVNEVLREVLAEALERLADADERLALLTITGVETVRVCVQVVNINCRGCCGAGAG